MYKKTIDFFQENFFQTKEDKLNEKKLKLKNLYRNERMDYQNYIQEIENNKKNNNNYTHLMNNNYYNPENNLDNLNKKLNFDYYNKNIYKDLDTTNKEIFNNINLYETNQNNQKQYEKNIFQTNKDKKLNINFNNYDEQMINKNSFLNNRKDLEIKNLYNKPNNNLEINLSPTLIKNSNQKLDVIYKKIPETYNEKNLTNYLDSPNDDLFRKQKEVENLIKQKKLFEKDNKFIQNDTSFDYKKEFIYPLSYNLPALEVLPFYKNKSNALYKYKQQLEDKNKLNLEKENKLNEQLTKNFLGKNINFELPFNSYIENKNEFLENKTKNISTYTNLTHTMTMNQSLKNSPNFFPKNNPEKLYELKEKYNKINSYKKMLDEQIRNRPTNSYMCFNNDKRIEVPPNPCKIILLIFLFKFYRCITWI
jgi:hypothetical protein